MVCSENGFVVYVDKLLVWNRLIVVDIKSCVLVC